MGRTDAVSVGRAKNRLGIGALNTRRPGFYADGGNLYLRVDKGDDGSLRRSWIFRYRLHGSGRDRDMGLGPVSSVRLQKARELAADYREMVATGIDPIEQRRVSQAETLKGAPVPNFDEVAAQYIAAHSAGWRSATHGHQWVNTLATFVSPVMGKLPVNMIDTRTVLRAIEPHWQSRTVTMKRVRARIESVLAFATVREWRSGPNPAQWKNHLDKLLAPPRKVAPVEHHPALPYEQMGAFMGAMEALALQFCILTTARTGEVTCAEWAEVDTEKRVWTIPRTKTKNVKEHRIPLSDDTLAVLAQAKALAVGDCPIVFPRDLTGRALTHDALRYQLQCMGRSDITVHGFRSSFRTWCAERTNFPRSVAEAAHSTANPHDRRSDSVRWKSAERFCGPYCMTLRLRLRR